MCPLKLMVNGELCLVAQCSNIPYSKSMECDVPIEVLPGDKAANNVRLIESIELNESSNASHPQPIVHAEIRITRGSTASRDTVHQTVGAYLRGRQGTCTLPILLEPALLNDFSSSMERAFFKENI